jgi:hypothetical protein
MGSKSINAITGISLLFFPGIIVSLQIEFKKVRFDDLSGCSLIPSYKMILPQDNLSLSKKLLRSVLSIEDNWFELLVPYRDGFYREGSEFLPSTDAIFPRAKVASHPGFVYAVLRAETIDS